ncbi:MAG: DUF748 domain-containing protein [Draconibacterium sp.]|nr:DUF748 domain-containing protein [Draconibacterium sp.]
MGNILWHLWVGMKQKIVIRITLGIAAFVLLIVLLTKVVVEPWVGKKIQASLNENSSAYQIKIEKVHVSIFRSGIELENITLHSKQENEGQSGLTGEIESVKFKGIHLMKALFKKDYHVREVDIFNSRIIGKVAFQKKTSPARVSPVNISIENLFFDKLFVDLKDSATAQSYLIKDGVLKVFDINVLKNGTISPKIFGQLDFDAPEFKTVTSDSLYSFIVVGINYSAGTNTLTADSFAVHPNYTEYGFTARSKFQTNRIDANLIGIIFYNFSITDYIQTGNIISSYIEIGELEMQVFKDKRKEFKHVEKPTFQDMIYNYPRALNIDSIGILSGNIVYTEHSEKAIEKGSISFNEIDAQIYKITNDTIYKTEKAYLELRANALLMGKGKLSILLKARIFDNQNTFAVNGTLSGMEVSELNPILEKSASITITSGKINSMNFSFAANNTKATGNMNLLYEGLKFDIMNRQTGETTAFKEQVKSWIANIILIESNPMPGKEVRPGIIEYERDPERFLFGYFFRSILSGMKTIVTKVKNARKSKK